MEGSEVVLFCFVVAMNLLHKEGIGKMGVGVLVIEL